MVLYYPDISHYQGRDSVPAGTVPNGTYLPLDQVKAAGYAALCVKIGQGASTATGAGQTLDADWPTFRDQGRALWPRTFAGYWYLGDGAETPASQASRCAGYIGDKSIPIMLDWENGGGTYANLQAVLAAFQAAGLNVTMLYTRASYASAQGAANMDALGLTIVQARYYDTSIAGPDYLYSQVPDTWWNAFSGGTPEILQFSQNCTIIPNWNIDCNAFRGTQSELETAFGYQPTVDTSVTMPVTLPTVGPVVDPAPEPSSGAYAALRQSHGVRSRVTAHTAAGAVLDVPVIGGTVTYDSGSNVRRQASLTFANVPGLWPLSPWDILSPWGTELEINYGVVMPGGAVEYVPLMIGPIQKVTRNLPGTDAITVTVSDYCAYLSDDRFDTTTSTPGTGTIVQQIITYIQQTIPGAVVNDLTGDTTSCPVVDMQQDRLAGIVKLATSIGAEVYCDRTGGFVIAYAQTVDSEPSFALSGKGLLLEVAEDADRATVYNRVRASGQSNSGTTGTASVPPVYAIAEDTDGASVTQVTGPFGRKTRFYASSFITSTAQAQTAANALLAKVKGTAVTADLTAMVDPTLEAGQAGNVTYSGETSIHVLDSVTIPLTAKDTQALKSRTPVLPSESDDAT